MKKAEDLKLNKVPKLEKFDFFTVFTSLVEMNKERKDLIVNLCHYDNFTRENFFIMNLINKIPFFIDNNRIAKWIITDYLSKYSVKISETKPSDYNYTDVIEKCIKEGNHLIVEQVDDKVYPFLKNIIRENFFNSNKSVIFDYQQKEINEKFKLILLKDKLNTNITSKLWTEALVLNFMPPRTLVKSYIIKELILSENKTLWENYFSVLQEITKYEFTFKTNEEEIHSVFNQIDLQGHPDKLQKNIELKEELSELFARHTETEENITSSKQRKDELKQEMYKYELLSEDASRIYKLLAKFIYLDNVYNISFNIYCKLIIEYYNTK